jgi:hypothetical protein
MTDLAKEGRAQAHLLPGEGHLRLADHHYGEILNDLLRLAGRAG